MEKLENETWEEYAIRHELFIVKYSDKEEKNIIDVRITESERTNFDLDLPVFTGIIWCKIVEIKNKYNLNGYDCYQSGISKNAELIINAEDVKRLNRLYELKHFWEENQKKIRETYVISNRRRIIELTNLISETHNEQLGELLKLVSIWGIGPTKNKEEYNNIEREKEEKIKEKKRELIELYHKHMNNKKIQSEISELEEKIKKLKGDLV
jgi:hypothetical protein